MSQPYLQIWKRRKEIQVSKDYIWEIVLSLSLGRQVRTRIEIPGLPASAHLCSVYFDHQTDSFSLIACDESFPLTPEGSMCERLETKLNL